MLPRHLPDSLQRGVERAERLPTVWGAILLTPVLVVVPTLITLSAFVLVFLVSPVEQGLTPFLPDFDSIGIGFSIVLLLVGLLHLAATWLALWAWLRYHERRPLTSIGLFSERPVKHLFGGLLTAATVIGLSVAVIAALGQIGFEPDFGDSLLRLILSLALGLVSWVARVGAETAIFFGWLLSVLSTRRSVTFGLVVSSLLFALLHSTSFDALPINLLYGANLGLVLTAFVNVFLVGLLSGLYAVLQGDLWGAFGLHIAFGALPGSVFRPLFVTELTPLNGLSLQGPALVTGSALGLGGSLIMTLFLLSALGIVLWWLHRKEAAKERDGA